MNSSASFYSIMFSQLLDRKVRPGAGPLFQNTGSLEAAVGLPGKDWTIISLFSYKS